MKNNESFIKLYDLEKRDLYSVTNERKCFNHLGVDITKMDNGSEIIWLERKKIRLISYLKWRDEKESWFKNSEKGSKKEIKRYVADFETIGQKQAEKENTAYVWAGCCMNILDKTEYVITTNINDFMKNVKKLKNADVFFHNLKFDGSYLLNYFNEMGIECVPRDQGRKGTFSCHIANGQYYTITWFLSDNDGNKHKQDKITFIDSLKILPTTIKQLGESFKDKLGGIGKIEEPQEFYDEFRERGHQITERETSYILQDCRVLAVALEYMIYELGHTHITMAGNAFHNFKELFKKDINNLLDGEVNPDHNYNEHFPKLPFGIMDENGEPDDKGAGWNTWIMKSYKGGYTFAHKDYRGKEVGKGLVFDVTSLYPFVMYTQLLPYGNPLWFDGDYSKIPHEDKKDYPLYIQKIKVEFEIKKGFLPTIPDKSKSRKNADYLDSSNGKIHELYLTNIDLELFKKHYDVIGEIQYIGGYMFKGKKGIFREYIDHWMKVKADADLKGDEGMRFIAKLFLNSLYGKFATRWDKPASLPFFKNGILSFRKIKKWTEITIDEQMEDYNDQVRYPAIASFITAFARKITIEAGQKNYDRFIYCDTDSLHLKGTERPIGIEIDELQPKDDYSILVPKNETTGKIGLWKHECTFEWAKFIRAKTYVEEYAKKGGNKKLHVTVAGMSADCHKHVTKENFGDYEGGELVSGTKGVYAGNKRTKMYKGGLVVCSGLYVMRANGGNHA